jgi:hypothetical protein
MGDIPFLGAWGAHLAQLDPLDLCLAGMVTSLRSGKAVEARWRGQDQAPRVSAGPRSICLPSFSRPGSSVITLPLCWCAKCPPPQSPPPCHHHLPYPMSSHSTIPARTRSIPATTPDSQSPNSQPAVRCTREFMSAAPGHTPRTCRARRACPATTSERTGDLAPQPPPSHPPMLIARSETCARGHIDEQMSRGWVSVHSTNHGAAF